MKLKIGLLIILIVFATAISGCLGGGEEDTKEPVITYVVKAGGKDGPYSGYTGENDETTVDINFNHTYIVQATFKLTWTDTNNNGDPESSQDDTFTIEVTPPNGSGEPAKNSGAGSSVTLDIDSAQNLEEPMENSVGWKVKITCEPGEGSSGGPGLGIFIFWADSGNDWTLNVEYKYLQAMEETT
ncbi:MAG: hypothetical protein JSV56_13045 [Methanomassiliicoccales archaeon]|nr:MAG: hypothetical protein JSV56_13045 [Methanomassiliicoccales archaeon]